MRTSLVRLAVMGTAAGALALAGATAVSAATSTPSPAPNGATKTRHHGHFRVPRVAGEVVSDSASGGTQGKGALVLKEPDGTQITLNLTAATRARRYQGAGVKPVSESATSLPAGEVVIVAGRGLRVQDHLARHILDLGFKATG